jgi:predicted RecA/RadA family phage recombinase
MSTTPLQTLINNETFLAHRDKVNSAIGKVNEHTSTLSDVVTNAYNVGSTSYLGVFKDKTGNRLDFKRIGSDPSSPISVTEDQNAQNITVAIDQSRIDHDALQNYTIEQHRQINDMGESSNSLWSSAKITEYVTQHAGETYTAATEGVFTLAAKSADTPAVGAVLYWDATLSELTTTASSHNVAGYAYEAKASGVTTMKVKINA